MKLVSIKLAMLCAFIWLNSINASAQCLEKGTSYKSKAFIGISDDKKRTGIVQKFNQFIAFYCNNNFQGASKMLSPDYFNSTRKVSGEAFTVKDWINEKLEFYSDRKTKFVLFSPRETIELPNENEWKIYGCLNEIVDGKKSKIEAEIQIFMQNGEVYFGDIKPVVISLNGKSRKCS